MKSTMRTALGNVRGLGSAKAGSDHFWKQRLTAIANIPLTIGFVVLLLAGIGKPYAEARALLASPLASVLMLLIIGSSVIHMRLGMQVIIEDYVHGEGRKIAAIVANNFFAIIVGVAASLAILKLAFGN